MITQIISILAVSILLLDIICEYLILYFYIINYLHLLGFEIDCLFVADFVGEGGKHFV